MIDHRCALHQRNFRSILSYAGAILARPNGVHQPKRDERRHTQRGNKRIHHNVGSPHSCMRGPAHLRHRFKYAWHNMKPSWHWYVQNLHKGRPKWMPCPP
ncbi:hypothetical protein A0H81_06434 [Grifola frondosa]|uniref:Uncharacterized protein n=1 Tax=Grifola frondosa TaxID=5627 RepID=A0A1C7MBV6_GRIFR|nr:hypothetical protein A0H81_06434 [Grifola frondosa]